MKSFEYGNFLVSKRVDKLEWHVLDMNYGSSLGNIEFEEGPGAIFIPDNGSILDASNLLELSNLMFSINERVYW